MKVELFVKVREATEDYLDVVSCTIVKFKEMKQPEDEINTLETLAMDLNNYLKNTSGYHDFIRWSNTSIDNPALKDQSWVPCINYFNIIPLWQPKLFINDPRYKAIKVATRRMKMVYNNFKDWSNYHLDLLKNVYYIHFHA